MNHEVQLVLQRFTKYLFPLLRATVTALREFDPIKQLIDIYIDIAIFVQHTREGGVKGPNNRTELTV